jgi:hypothetical protein
MSFIGPLDASTYLLIISQEDLLASDYLHINPMTLIKERKKERKREEAVFKRETRSHHVERVSIGL